MMTDEERTAANTSVGSCDEPGTYTGDRIEELEEEVKRLREIEEAVREYQQAVMNAFQARAFRSGSVTKEGVAVALDVHAKAHRRLDALLRRGETK